jgi:DNA-binding transcriptional ArsR family regulator
VTGAGASIARIIGDDAMRALIAWRGGRELRVPSNEADLAPIADAIGEQAALSLMEEAAGCKFSIPRAVPRGRYTPPVSTIRVQRLKDQGLKVGEIARELRVTERTVYVHLAKARDAS